MVDISQENVRLVQRFCGGWLAFSTRTNPLHIGVTADTAEEAKAKYGAALDAWRGMLADADRANGRL